ncbi:hypothetical protein [Plantactinospora sp. GCM10030261]|uniref:CTP synthase C-terminal region-related (seleno)protein n=1 Tax=Plantactinospora sp. GCM10030261 TaxID=3273420 RepID=UPI00360BCA6F
MVISTRVALVGDRSPHVRSHTRAPAALAALRHTDGLDLDVYWIPTAQVRTADAFDGFDGIWLLPGSPYESEAGALAAVRAARTGGIPFLGTCGGFQHALLEYARAVCGLATAGHAENDPAAEDLVIEPLSCSLVGHEGTVRTMPGTLAERIIGADQTMERYHCAYGPNPRYLDLLARNGLRFSGHDEQGAVRIAELPEHPFFLGTLFQPELAETDRPHPVIRAFAAAACRRAGLSPIRDDVPA